MTTCPKCGLPVEDDAKFCAVCGARISRTIKSEVCKVCGSQLKEGAKFCNVCGSPVGDSEKDKEEQQKMEQEERNPTMDEIAVPEITDNMPGLEEISEDKNAPTMDSVEMPGEKPREEPKPAVEEIPIPEPVPIPEPKQPEPVVSQPYQPTQNTAQQSQPSYQQTAQPTGVHNVNVNNGQQYSQTDMNKHQAVPGQTAKVILPIAIIAALVLIIIICLIFLM